jgi:hypothetical protein
MKKIFLLSAIFLFAGAAFCGNTPLALKSVIVPGLGQISAGQGEIKSKNTLKGLGIMAGFTICLQGTISSISARESYAEQTRYYAGQIAANNISGNYGTLQQLHDAHSKAYDNYNSANTMMFVYLTLTAAFYGYGIVDALLFTKEDEKKSENAGIVPRNLNLAVGKVGRCGGIQAAYKF